MSELSFIYHGNVLNSLDPSVKAEIGGELTLRSLSLSMLTLTLSSFDGMHSLLESLGLPSLVKLKLDLHLSNYDTESSQPEKGSEGNVQLKSR